jgi:Lon protease-like protein
MYDSSKGNQDSSNIAKIGCVGRIISNEETDEGRKNIILYGISRIKIDEIIYSKPYRQAKINIVSQTKSSDSIPLSKRITDLTNEWNLLLEDYNENYKIKIDSEASLSKLTDSLSSIVVTSTNERQWFLEETNEAKRALKLIETLESRIDYLMGKIELPDKDSESIN